jgi:hypothetical protein
MKLVSVIKMGAFNSRIGILIKGIFCGGVAQEVSKGEMFWLMDPESRKSFYKNLIESPNKH